MNGRLRAFNAMLDIRHINEFVNTIKTKYPLDDVIRILNTRNPVYKGKLGKYLDYEKNRELINQGLLQQIPDNYIDLFPLARHIQEQECAADIKQ